MAVVCPTVTAFDPHEYRSQMELLESFAKRVHIDLMDGEFAPTKSPGLETIWWPDGIIADVHLMYQRPAPYLEQLIRLKPSLVVIHAEAELDHADFAAKLRAKGIKAGLGILQKTTIEDVAPLLGSFDHVMVFSGNLGYHGGSMPETPQEGEKVMAAWNSWMGSLGKALVDGGNPTAPGRTIAATGTRERPVMTLDARVLQASVFNEPQGRAERRGCSSRSGWCSLPSAPRARRPGGR